MSGMRALSTLSSSTNRAAMRSYKSVMYEFQHGGAHQLHRQGADIVVHDGNVEQAYSALKRVLRDANVRMQLRQNSRYVKPKYQRQQLEEKMRFKKNKAEFKEKVAAALELMRSGF